MRKKMSFVMKIFGNGIDERLKGIFISPVQIGATAKDLNAVQQLGQGMTHIIQI